MLCESRGGRPGLPVPNSPAYGLCGRKATLNLNSYRAQELCENRGGHPGLNSPYGLCLTVLMVSADVRQH